MQINRRLTNGLAWAGLLLVVGVPSAELISSQFMDGDATAGRASVVTTSATETSARPQLNSQPGTDPVQTASIRSDPVDNFVGSGRQLPSYISDGNTSQSATPPSAAPAATTARAPANSTTPANGLSTTTVSAPDTQVASVSPTQKIAPVPMPASMRPASVASSTVPRGMAPNALNSVTTTPPTATASTPAASTPPASTGGQLFFPQSVQPQTTATAPATTRPVTPAPVNTSPVVPPANVGSADYYGAEDLEGWESGPLSDFLAQRGGSNEGYYEDEYYVDENPNSSASYDRRYRDGSEVISITPIY